MKELRRAGIVQSSTPTKMRGRRYFTCICIFWVDDISHGRPDNAASPTAVELATNTTDMTQLAARLQEDMNAARKAQDKPRVLLLGTMLSDIRNREIELKRDLTEDDVIDVLRRGIKRRRESIEMYDKGGRADLAATEKAEVDALG